MLYSVEHVSANSAKAFSRFIDKGSTGVVEKGVCVSTNPLPTVDDVDFPYCSGHDTCICPMYELENNTEYYVRAYAQNDAGLSYSNQLSFTTKASEPLVDQRDGRVYGTTRVGSQVWMAENLDYRTDSGSVYYNNDSLSKSVNSAMGRLYVWGEAIKACPDGWHLPSDDEWEELERQIGMDDVEIDLDEWRGAEAWKLRQLGYAAWVEGANKATNEFGLSIIGSGSYSGSLGRFEGKKYYANFWTASETNKFFAISRVFHNDEIYRGEIIKNKYYSVRCIKD